MSDEYRHSLLLLYWPVYGLFFLYFERIRSCTYHAVECGLDSLVPFIPAFVIPYYFWFVFLIGMLIYTFFFDVNAFRKYMWFVILTYSATILIYFIYPTCQNLRPEVTETDIFSRIVSGLYAFDTNTNVCPSIHVLGSFAVCFASWHCEKLKHPLVIASFFVVALLISVSTVFLKQHSVIDIFYAVIVSVLCYPLVFCKNRVSEKLLSIF